MKHNVFKFTLRVEYEETTSANAQIERYVSHITKSLNHKQAEMLDVYTIPVKAIKNTALSYVQLEVRDYGVGQIGIDIINLWMYRLFVGHVKSSLGIKTKAIVCHPLTNVATGALIEWDWKQNKPVIYEFN